VVEKLDEVVCHLGGGVAEEGFVGTAHSWVGVSRLLEGVVGGDEPRLSKIRDEYLSPCSWPYFRVCRCQAVLDLLDVLSM
jgi:hypothetical protein